MAIRSQSLHKLFLLLFLIAISSSQLINTKIFNVFGFSYARDVITGNWRQPQNLTEKQQNKAQPSEQQDDPCHIYRSSLKILVFAGNVTVEIQGEKHEVMTFQKEKLKPGFQLNNHTVYSSDSRLSENYRSMESDKQENKQKTQKYVQLGYLSRRSTLGLEWTFNFQITEQCIMIGIIRQYDLVVPLIGILYTLLNLIILPPSREHLSQISRRTVIPSLFIDFYVLTCIMLVLLLQLGMRLKEFQLSVQNLLSILAIGLVEMLLAGYWIGISFCLLRQIQRYQLMRSFSSNLIQFFIFGSVIGFPFFLAIFEKGVHFYFLTFLGVFLQMGWSCYAKTIQSFRYILHALLTIFCLIFLNRYYPTLNYQQLSPVEIYLLGTIGFTAIGFLGICCCKGMTSESQDIQNQRNYQDIADTVTPAADMSEIPQISEH